MGDISRVFLYAKGRDMILRAAGHQAPHEACGLLFGNRAGSELIISDVTLAVNIADEPWHGFEVDHAHLFAAQRRARRGREQLLGVWHSHPGGTIEPSAADAAGVVDRNWLWLIVAQGKMGAWLPARNMAVHNGFRRLDLSTIAGVGDAAMLSGERHGH